MINSTQATKKTPLSVGRLNPLVREKVSGGERSPERTGLWSKFPVNREFTGNFLLFWSIWPVFAGISVIFRSDYIVLLSNSLLFKEQGIYCEEQGINSAEQGRKLEEQGRGLMTR